jgi:S-formylglutathione hydrolase FrmB
VKRNVLLLTLTLFLIALGLSFALGWVLSQRRIAPAPPANPALSFEIDIPQDTPPGEPLYLAGSFNDWNPADPTYLLTRTADLASGSWVFTPGLVLEYKVTRGSWQTVEKGTGGVETTNHVVTTTSGQLVRGKVVGWADVAYREDALYDPRVERVDLLSAALGVRRTFYVYVPPEARSDENLRVPSVYLLRGHEREWINKGEDSSRAGQRNVIDVYEELRAAGAIGPTVLVFPGMTSANGAIHSAGINMRAPELANDKTIGSGRFEDYFFSDLIPYVETHFPVLFGGAHRAIDGFSLGGFMSVNMALRQPTAFASVGAYDGLYFWDEPELGTTIALTDTVFMRSLFDADYGVPRDQTFAAQNNPLTLLRMDGVHAQRLQWLIEYGPQAAEPNVNYFRGVRLDELLVEVGATNRLGGALPDGSHTWEMADEHMRRTLPLHWQRIK